MRRDLSTLIFVIVAIAVVLIVTTLIAHAGTIPPTTVLESVEEIPAEFRGAWCETKKPNIMKRCRKPLDEGDVELTATALILGDTSCQHDKILVSRNRRYLSLRARCGIEANTDEWIGGFQMWLIGSKWMEYRE